MAMAPSASPTPRYRWYDRGAAHRRPPQRRRHGARGHHRPARAASGARGEHKARPLENMRDGHVFVVQSLYGDDALSVNDKLVRLLFFLGALKDTSAARVTAVLP